MSGISAPSSGLSRPLYNTCFLTVRTNILMQVMDNAVAGASDSEGGVEGYRECGRCGDHIMPEFLEAHIRMVHGEQGDKVGSHCSAADLDPCWFRFQQVCGFGSAFRIWILIHTIEKRTF